MKIGESKIGETVPVPSQGPNEWYINRRKKLTEKEKEGMGGREEAVDHVQSLKIKLGCLGRQ